MKVLNFLFLTAAAVFGCSSECIQCHPKLKGLYSKNSKYYKQHAFLKSCTKCHPNHSEKGMDKCGADCFECHSRSKLVNTDINEHRKLKNCTKCHSEPLQKILPVGGEWKNFDYLRD